MRIKPHGSALSKFLRRTVPYESLGAPLDANLQQTLIISLVLSLIASVGFLAFANPLPEVGDDVALGFALWPLRGFLNLLHEVRFIAFWLNLGALLLGLTMVVATRGLEEATRRQNWVCLVPVGVAAVDGLGLVIVLALIIYIALVWLVAIVLGILIGILIFVAVIYLIGLFLAALFK